MANLSSAYGTLTIPHWLLEEDKLVEILHRFFEEYEEPYYGVTYWEISPDDIYKAAENGRDLDIEFFGTGRWTFYRCVEDPEWFFYVDKNPAGAEIIKYLESLTRVELPIEWIDEEGGCEVLYSCEGVLWLEADGKLRFREDICEDYEYTDANLIKLGCYDCGYTDLNEVYADLQLSLERPLTDEEKAYVSDEFESRGGAFIDWRFDDVYCAVRDGLI